MTRPGEWMLREIAEIPQVIARQLTQHGAGYAQTGARLRRNPPRFFATCARGTSDHAALFFKYLTESRTGVPVVTLGPSLGSIYEADLQLKDAVLLSISQSGRSPDLVALQHRAKQGGAATIAVLNTIESPLGRGADIVLPIGAGPEQAVAATKSFVTSLTALLAIHAGQTEDRSLLAAVHILAKFIRTDCAHSSSPLLHITLSKERHQTATRPFAVGQRREMAGNAVARRGASNAPACRTFGVSETCYRHGPKLRAGNEAIADLLVGLTDARKTRGFGLGFLHLRNVTGRAIAAIGSRQWRGHGTTNAFTGFTARWN